MAAARATTLAAIRDRLQLLGFNQICFGHDADPAVELDRLERLATLGRELTELCEQRAKEMRDNQ